MARTLVALYLGLRQAGDLDEPEQFLRQMERSLMVALPGMVPTDRVDYFLQFTRRRTALAVKTTSADPAVANDRAG